MRLVPWIIFIHDDDVGRLLHMLTSYTAENFSIANHDIAEILYQVTTLKAWAYNIDGRHKKTE